MSYKSALIAAGAEVLEFQEFGSYSGQWFAKVCYNGETGWVHSWYGSCTMCDQFQAEFDSCYDSQELPEDYNKRLADFGKTFLGGILPAEHFLPELDEDSDWDEEDAEAAAWIRKIEGISNE